MQRQGRFLAGVEAAGGTGRAACVGAGGCGQLAGV